MAWWVVQEIAVAWWVVQEIALAWWVVQEIAVAWWVVQEIAVAWWVMHSALGQLILYFLTSPALDPDAKKRRSTHRVYE